MKYLSLIFVGIILLVLACQNQTQSIAQETEQPPLPQRVKAVYNAEDRTYFAHWGDLTLPVVNDPLPGNQAKTLIIPKDSLEAVFEQPLSFTKGGEKMDLDLIAVVVYSPNRTNPYMYHYGVDGDFFVKPERGYEQLLNFLKAGAHFSLRGFKGNTPINSVSFAIREPEGRYYPPVYFGDISTRETAVYGFQMYTETGRKTLIRMDTLAEETANIYQMYRHKTDAYEILHLPGFKTIRRAYAADTEKLWPSNDFKRINLIDKTANLPLDMEFFSEYYDFGEKETSLKWGEWSTPMYFDQILEDDFRAHFKKDLKLQIGKETYKLERFDLWITSESQMDVLFNTETLKHELIQKAFAELPGRSSIYFDHVLIKNEAGELIWFPGNFAYHVHPSVTLK